MVHRTAGGGILPRSPERTRPDRVAYDARMGEGRRLAAIVVLFVIGFAMVGLADAVDSVWPLFITPAVYAAIPWIVTRPGAVRSD